MISNGLIIEALDIERHKNQTEMFARNSMEIYAKKSMKQPNGLFTKKLYILFFKKKRWQEFFFLQKGIKTPFVKKCQDFGRITKN